MPRTINDTVAMAMRNIKGSDLRSLSTSLSWKRPRIRPRRKAPAKVGKVAKQHILPKDNCNYGRAFTFRVELDKPDHLRF